MSLIKTRVCFRCKQTKTISEFPKNKRRSTGYTHDCKICRNKKHRDWYNKNKITIAKQRKNNYDPIKAKEDRLKSRYNLTIKQHKNMYISQNGCCAICKNPIPYEDIKVDHCHLTGKVRKLLCDSCNKGLGNFNDTTTYLKFAIKYLNEFS